jgi:CBS-domain-containing membrane protein
MNQCTVQDVMTIDVMSVRMVTPYQEVIDVLAQCGGSALPVLDDYRRVLGTVSQADLLGQPHTRAAGGLMNAPAVTVQPGASLNAAVNLLDAHELEQLPVVDKFGHLVGMVARRDLAAVAASRARVS